jgi:hypothetical protein
MIWNPGTVAAGRRRPASMLQWPCSTHLRFPLKVGVHCDLTTAALNTRQGHRSQAPSLYREPLPFPSLRARAQLLERAEVYDCVSGWLRTGRPEVSFG